VYVDGVFTMSGGTIGGNTAKESGGGVYVSGTFTKSGTGGIIYGSNASEDQANKAGADKQGHAVYVRGTRDYVRDSTADEATALDSKKNRIQGGGWEYQM
jgi:predicted outer membrane repeat protein